MINKFLLFTLVIISTTINGQNWLKANLQNKWQFIQNNSNKHFFLTTARFVDTSTFNNEKYYNYSILPFNSIYMRYDSSLNQILYNCGSTRAIHCDFNQPLGIYTQFKNVHFTANLGCGSTVNIFDTDSFSIGGRSFQTRHVRWGFRMGTFIQDSFYTIYANGLGMIYHFNKTINLETKEYTLYQCLIDGVVYKNNIYISLGVQPILRISNPNFQLTFSISHPFNRIFPLGSPNTTLLMIDTVWFHSFYEKNGDTTLVEKQRAGWLGGTDKFIVNKELNMNYLMNGYSFNYRIEAIDKGLAPNIAYAPQNGFYKAILDSAINMSDRNLIVQNYELEQNFPNPFNNSTRIGFISKQEDFVSLEVFDLLGQKIKTLFNDYVLPGRYEIEFDLSDINEVNSSQILFYKLKSSAGTLTKKMVIQK